VAALTGFRGQLAQLATRQTLWWSAVSDLFSFSWVCTALVLSVWIMHFQFDASVVAGLLLALVCAAVFGYIALGKAMVRFDCSVQAFVPSAGLLAPPGELLMALALLCVDYPEPAEAEAEPSPRPSRGADVETFLLMLTMMLGAFLVVWREQGKSFMVQQVLRREQFILASGISAVVVGLLQVRPTHTSRARAGPLYNESTAGR
jgi:hypothetical protein